MPVDIIEEVVIPRLKKCQVMRVTLTGGEPFLHPDIVEIARIFSEANMPVGICTNGAASTTDQIKQLAMLGNVHVNVSLDGLKPESHGKFRGDVNSFEKTIETIRQLAKYELLQGLLVTPNNLAEINEYAGICDLAIQSGASYVLMNPLSSFGSGVRSKAKLGTSRATMEAIRRITAPFCDRIQIVYVRFPNAKLVLNSCVAGSIVYVFAHGEMAICPYLVFAARTPKSKYDPQEFIVGNILIDPDIEAKLDKYALHKRYQLGGNTICKACSLFSICGKGCPASIIASGRSIEEVDVEVCPIHGSKKESND